MGTFEALYAGQYDQMYGKKDYARETQALEQLLAHADGPVKSVLSIGCGTLGHERFLAKKGFRIRGIDQSPEMVALAKQRIVDEHLEGVTVEVGDMRHIVPGDAPYDAVVSVFNVVSYCKGIEELEQVIDGAARSLRAGGVFVFDCWYAAAVRKDPPRDRLAKFASDGKELYRFTTSVPDMAHRRIGLEIELLQIEGDRVTARSTERHDVSFWDIEELRTALSKYGLELVSTGGFPEIDQPPSDQFWAMSVVAKKPLL